MTASADLLAELDARGVQLEANGDRLRFRPREKVPAELVARMKAHKAELLAAVRRREALDRRIDQQLAQLVPYQTDDGRRGWVHPQYRHELESLGLLGEHRPTRKPDMYLEPGNNPVDKAKTPKEGNHGKCDL